MAFDAFLKISTALTGESTDDKHKGEIELLSFSLGALEPDNYRVWHGRRRCRQGVTSPSFSIMKKTDKTSPVLFADCATGEALPERLW